MFKIDSFVKENLVWELLRDLVVDIFDDMFSFFNENIIATICICLLLALWSIANIFFKSDSNSEISNGVLLENENGSLLITKDSICNLVDSVLKKNTDIKDSNVKIEFDQNKDIMINIVAVIKDNVVIKDTSSRLQENIKLTVKKATDLDVSNINIKIKNVEQEKVNFKNNWFFMLLNCTLKSFDAWTYTSDFIVRLPRQNFNYFLN